MRNGNTGVASFPPNTYNGSAESAALIDETLILTSTWNEIRLVLSLTRTQRLEWHRRRYFKWTRCYMQWLWREERSAAAAIEEEVGEWGRRPVADVCVCVCEIHKERSTISLNVKRIKEQRNCGSDNQIVTQAAHQMFFTPFDLSPHLSHLVCKRFCFLDTNVASAATWHAFFTPSFLPYQYYHSFDTI